MGEIRNEYKEVDMLPMGALPVLEYAKHKRWSRSYVHIRYDRHHKGFIKGSVRYYSKDPEYTIVLFHGKPYVIDPKLTNY